MCHFFVDVCVCVGGWVGGGVGARCVDILFSLKDRSQTLVRGLMERNYHEMYHEIFCSPPFRPQKISAPPLFFFFAMKIRVNPIE